MSIAERRERALEKVLQARALQSPSDAIRHYAGWAASYDQDVFAELQMTGTGRVAGLLEEYVTCRQTEILDAGCGTGAAAEHLKQFGYKVIDGVDLSPEMLEVARSKGLYRHLIEGNLNDALVLPRSPYAAILSAGTFTTGHVGLHAFKNLYSQLALNGILAATIADTVWQRDGFDDLIKAPGTGILFHRMEAAIAGSTPDTHMLVISRTY